MFARRVIHIYLDAHLVFGGVAVLVRRVNDLYLFLGTVFAALLIFFVECLRSGELDFQRKVRDLHFKLVSSRLQLLRLRF